MTNLDSPGGEPQQPTTPAAPQAPTASPTGRGHRAAFRMLGVAAAAVLAAGGVAAGLALAAPSAPAAQAGSPSHSTGSSQALLLNQALSAAGSPGGTPPGSGRYPGRPCRAARRRQFLGFLIRSGIDGQLTLQTPRGVRTLAYERGVVQSVDPGISFTVKAANGTMWTWHLGSDSVVRDAAGLLSARSLSPGQTVWVGGPVTAGSRDARLVFLRPPSRGARAATGAPGAS
jgi:hypothetical protein